ncbi:hypothetical protein ABN236_16460 [Proteus sp. fly-1013]|uniref:hypothetical protein n=1 Tax=Proteus sp. fly-1013 TaxID=3136673 RepID=UPI0032DA2AF4
MPKIYGLWGVTLPLSLPRYTKTNSHQVSAVACCGYKRFGISRFDNSLYQRLKMLALGVYPDISLADAGGASTRPFVYWAVNQCSVG